MIIITSFAEGLYDTANTSFGILTNTISNNVPSGMITHADKNSFSNNDTSLSLMVSTTTNIFYWYALGSNATWQLNESNRHYSYLTFY